MHISLSQGLANYFEKEQTVMCALLEAWSLKQLVKPTIAKVGIDNT